jgi:hypothetical protein
MLPDNEGEVDLPKSAEDALRHARKLPWAKGPRDYIETLQAWRAHGGMEGLLLSSQ